VTGKLKPPSPLVAGYETEQREQAADRQREQLRSGAALHSKQLVRLTTAELVDYADIAPSAERDRDVGLELLRRARNKAARKKLNEQERAAV